MMELEATYMNLSLFGCSQQLQTTRNYIYQQKTKINCCILFVSNQSANKLWELVSELYECPKRLEISHMLRDYGKYV